jgi:hypothetical protein
MKKMLLKNIILRKEELFEQSIQDWAGNGSIAVNIFDGSNSLTDAADAVVLFHEDYNISKENESVKELFLNDSKFAHTIDINGTLVASVSSFVFWLENHKPKRLLLVGDDKLTNNVKFKKYLDQLIKRL